MNCRGRRTSNVNLVGR